MDGIPAGSIKAFVQRDYSDGMAVKFEKIFPRELEGKVSRENFEQTVDYINRLYAEAEKLSCASCCEGCVACLTSYLFLCCVTTGYEKKVADAAAFIAEQNRSIYIPKGVYVVDPMLRGLRVLEFILIDSVSESAQLTL
ncbi:golgin subfamily A member 7-like [Watersipora subatra]|uniref:golgin subfamily A member 7-like n=1 Tax=Watersipora subatra TaxID=2589382 RepID=UPI00355BBE6B